MSPKKSRGSSKFPGGLKVTHSVAQTTFVRAVTLCDVHRRFDVLRAISKYTLTGKWNLLVLYIVFSSLIHDVVRACILQSQTRLDQSKRQVYTVHCIDLNGAS